jgi:Holliday junction DNA helicase RuvA
MIAFLKGKVLSVDGAGSVVLDVNGVGYLVYVTDAVIGGGLRSGAPLELIIHTDVRETEISLYGFANSQEKQIFGLLKKVKGIGSKSAVAIVSVLGAQRLLKLIGEGSTTELVKVPGIGKKTAERIVLELKEQVWGLLPQIDKAVFAASAGKSGTVGNGFGEELSQGAVGDVALALEKLGFSKERAKSAIERTISECSSVVPGLDQNSGELLRLALSRV